MPRIDRDALRAYLEGMSLGFNPLPARRRQTFIKSDEDAFRSDWEAVCGDMRSTFNSVMVEDRRERGC